MRATMRQSGTCLDFGACNGPERGACKGHFIVHLVFSPLLFFRNPLLCVEEAQLASNGQYLPLPRPRLDFCKLLSQGFGLVHCVFMCVLLLPFGHGDYPVAETSVFVDLLVSGSGVQCFPCSILGPTLSPTQGLPIWGFLCNMDPRTVCYDRHFLRGGLLFHDARGRRRKSVQHRLAFCPQEADCWHTGCRGGACGDPKHKVGSPQQFIMKTLCLFEYCPCNPKHQ